MTVDDGGVGSGLTRRAGRTSAFGGRPVSSSRVSRVAAGATAAMVVGAGFVDAATHHLGVGGIGPMALTAAVAAFDTASIYTLVSGNVTSDSVPTPAQMARWDALGRVVRPVRVGARLVTAAIAIAAGAVDVSGADGHTLLLGTAVAAGVWAGSSLFERCAPTLQPRHAATAEL